MQALGKVDNFQTESWRLFFMHKYVCNWHYWSTFQKYVVFKITKMISRMHCNVFSSSCKFNLRPPNNYWKSGQEGVFDFENLVGRGV